ncbi:hypothetical protein PGB34_18270 [Xenophilus arseniciresistens]|uniref:Uncharacterized protein n=1 Tax=Xenophilus arseniciresistens TaxID=1283306 RepID=A0AAE3NDM9_9BURK|nr:hypothetical protein [Xenophilus arseniciresistens]MDA7418317.1 hypothetical protein [Xenophilus arseniciresistens]
MNKSLITLATALSLLTLGSAHAQVGKAASEAADSVEHKVEQKRADNEAKKSGPVGKAVNKVKSGYHKNRAEDSKDNAKRALKNAA